MAQNTEAIRKQDMENDMIAFQILSRAASVTTLTMEPEAGAELTRELNDDLKRYRDGDPKRYAALAELPLQAPEMAVVELKRCVEDLGFVGAILHGSVNGKFLDDPEFDVVLSALEELDVPLYLHPGVPPKIVVDAYYTMPGNDPLSAMLAGPGWGWHQEVAIHVIRLAVSGTLDRHPKLKLVVGHQGEMMPMMMERFGVMFDHKAFGLQRSVPDMLRSQVWIAISGMFSIPVTQLSIEAWGVERVLFAVDYPMISSEAVPDFVRNLSKVMTPEDLRRVCQTNAEELFRVKA